MSKRQGGRYEQERPAMRRYYMPKLIKEDIVKTTPGTTSRPSNLTNALLETD